MKEIKAIVNAYSGIDFTRNQVALATVVRVEGSSYRRTGARMLVQDNGTYLGGISGGCLEGDALRRAQKAISSNKPSVVTYDTTQDDAQQIGVGLGCNGIIDVLFTPLKEKDQWNPVKVLSQVTGTRIPRIVLSIISDSGDGSLLGKSFLCADAASFAEDFPDAGMRERLEIDIEKALSLRVSDTVIYTTPSGEIGIFIEVVEPVIQLILYGASYDLYPMVRIARELGWDAIVVTNTSKADKSLYQIATQVLHYKSDQTPAIDDFSAILMMSHDYNIDFFNFQKSLDTKARYIGLLGPKKRAQKMFDALLSAGKPLSNENRMRVFAPAGLDIGANQPEEIALSILAEIKSHFAERPGTSLRMRESAIHSE